MCAQVKKKDNMLRRPPTKIELQSDDVAELKRMRDERRVKAGIPVSNTNNRTMTTTITTAAAQSRKDRIFGNNTSG